MAAERARHDHVADLFSFYRKAFGKAVARGDQRDRVAAAVKVKDDVRRQPEQMICVPVHVDLAFLIERHVNLPSYLSSGLP